MRAIYSADAEAAVALAAATVKTVFGVKADAGHAIQLLGAWFGFDGVASSEKPVLVEFCACTWATQPPGTLSTAVTVDQEAGPRYAETFSAARNWTTEPTVQTPIRSFGYDPNKGYWDRDFALGDEPDFAVAEGFTIRMTVPSGGAAVNVDRPGARWARV